MKSDVEIMAKILGSLPEKYNAFVTAWDSVECENQTLDKLRQCFIKRETRMNAADEASDALAAMSLKTSKARQKTKEKKPEHSKKDSVECFYCHKPVHYMKDCRKKKREDRSTRDKEKCLRQCRVVLARVSSSQTLPPRSVGGLFVDT